MRKNSDRSMSAALHHRKMSGSFERLQAEKRHSNMINGRNPILSRRSRDIQIKVDTMDGGSSMGLLPSLGVGVAVAGSMFVVTYAAVVTAMAEATLH